MPSPRSPLAILLPMLLLIGGHPFANGAEPLRQQDGQPLKIITHNVLYGFTQRTSPRYENWKAWMKSQTTDVVCLQELNEYTAEKLASDAATWGHSHSELLKTDGFPTGITSRFPISHVERIREGFHHGLLRCQIKGIWFYVIHFHPSNFARRVEEAALLAKDVCDLPERNPRIILAGDFNGFSPADKAHYDNDSQLVPFFQMLDQKNKDARNLNDGRLDYGGLQAILDLRYIDLIDRARDPGSPFVGTFPAKLVSDENHGTDRRLDYIFVTSNLIDSVETAAILRDDVTEQLSDHIPVTVTLRLDDRDAKADAPAPAIFTGNPELLQEHGAGEGPAWHPELGLLTSGEGNINVRDKAGCSSIYRQNAGSNGLMFDREGRLIICEPVRRRVTRLEQNGTTTVLAENFSGMKFNQPNDLTIDSFNRIYFSDPCYGDRSKMEMVDADGRKIEGVYRIDSNGNVTRIIAHEVDRPNGLVVTHDDKFLFVADNNNDTLNGARKLWRFNLKADGTVDVASQKLIYDWKTTRGPDGMKLDAKGRLFVAAGINKPNPPFETAESPTAGIYVFSPDGELLTFAPIPRDETTNCAFGGDDLKTLFVTAGGTLWKIPVETAGRPAWPLVE
ncbi:MAG: SMP-30/gluconolactonase/LRE family protein [Planctomycetaceae bacterium]